MIGSQKWKIVLLGEALPGEAGVVAGIDDSCQEDLLRRFFELGLSRGASVELTSVAPLGDPLTIMVKGYTLSLRRSEANMVKVSLRKFSLGRALEGKKLVVESVRGVALSSLLASKGIRKGSVLKMVENKGPVFVLPASSGSSPVRIGRGQASKIIVMELSGE